MTPEERAAECLRDLNKCGPEHVRHAIIRHIRALEQERDAARRALTSIANAALDDFDGSYAGLAGYVQEAARCALGEST